MKKKEYIAPQMEQVEIETQDLLIESQGEVVMGKTLFIDEEEEDAWLFSD